MLATSFDLSPQLAENLRRLMARQGISVDALAAASGVDRRTIAGVLHGKKRPHSRTLHRLAEALSVPADEFFQDPSLLAHRAFNRQTNPLVVEGEPIDGQRVLVRLLRGPSPLYRPGMKLQGCYRRPGYTEQGDYLGPKPRFEGRF